METKFFYFLSICLSLIFLSTCSDVNQSVSTFEVKQDSLANAQPSYTLNPIDTIISIFSGDDLEIEEDEGKQPYTSAYLDNATNDLFVMPAEIKEANPYGFKENELVTYPDSVYQQRFSNISSEIPLAYNRHVENFIDLYAVRKKELTERMFGKSILYFPYIERLLMEKSLPQELKYLTMVESALQPDASSHMEAVGLWQIRYRTGKWLGLEINDFFDGRRDPYESTKAAVAYLDRLYNIYGSWFMALAAYNSGPGNLNKAIIRAGGSRDYWKVRPYLPAETGSYVPAFMALVYLSKYQDEHNLRPVTPELSFEAVDTVRVYQEIAFEELSRELDLSQDDLRFLNPALIKNIVPASEKGRILVLPLNKVATFEAKRSESLQSKRMAVVEKTSKVFAEKEVLIPDGEGLKLVEHRVSNGQTIGGISSRYGVDIKQIKDWNGIRDNTIRVGQVLKVYVPDSKYGR